MGNNEILRRYTPKFERGQILTEAHGGAVQGHYSGCATAQKILPVGLWCLTLHQDSKAHYKAYDICQRIGKLSQRDEMPLNPQMTLQPFEKWAIDFVGPTKPKGKMDAHYIIATTKYLTRWVEAKSIKDCTVAMTVKFLFKNVLIGFGCLKILMRNHRTHFLNETISVLTEEFQWDGWDLRVPTVSWAYRTTCKKLTGQTPFWLVYGTKAVMPMEYIIPSLLASMTDRKALEERLVQLGELEEERFLDKFH
eukprot:PITA_10946